MLPTCFSSCFSEYCSVNGVVMNSLALSAFINFIGHADSVWPSLKEFSLLFVEDQGSRIIKRTRLSRSIWGRRKSFSALNPRSVLKLEI